MPWLTICGVCVRMYDLYVLNALVDYMWCLCTYDLYVWNALVDYIDG